MTEQGMINVIDKIAEKLSVPATELINAYMASGIKEVGHFIILMIVGLVFLMINIKIYKSEKEQNQYLSEREKNYFGTFCYSIFTIMFCGMAISCIPDIFFWLYNPKSYAILEIMKDLRVH